MPTKAVFLDRDDTLIRDPGYLRDPDAVQLMPGAAEAIARLRRAGYRIIVVTNQSGVARGLLDEATLDAIHDRLRRLLAERNAAIDGVYYCPYLDGPEAVIDRYRRDSDLRKPRPGMYLLAAREHDIDLAASWSIGDSARDTAAGRAAGCRTIELTADDPVGRVDSSADYRCRTLAEAADWILGVACPECGTKPGAAGGSPVRVPAAGPPAASREACEAVRGGNAHGRSGGEKGHEEPTR